MILATTYDSAGNRLTETTESGTVTSTYDITNRLTSVGGVSYTWDANGNLLSDGSKTYTYNHANRLKTVSRTGVSASYRYNGLGDRLEETVDGQTTHFTMDLSAGLPQAFSDGAHTYWYGVGRIAQESSSGQEYFLTDAGRKEHASGSVRQLADADSVNLVQSYEPYGEVMSQEGSGALGNERLVSGYSYTGE